VAVKTVRQEIDAPLKARQSQAFRRFTAARKKVAERHCWLK